jgi:excisionase family DNA binding protein
MPGLNSQLRRGSIRLNMMQASSNSEFLTVAEVADLLKLNPQTIRNMIDRGDLTALRVGRRVRIRALGPRNVHRIRDQTGHTPDRIGARQQPA